MTQTPEALLNTILPCVVPCDTDGREEYALRMEAQQAASELYQLAKAAPELLEALRIVAESGRMAQLGPTAFRAIRAAIQKAE